MRIWIVIGMLSVGTAMLKASGPVVFVARHLSIRAKQVIALLPAAVLAGLLVIETLTTDHAHQLAINARAAGLLTAALALRARAPLVIVLIIAAAVTALLRAV